MRRSGITLLFAAGLSLGMSAGALAADMALKAPPPVPLFDWTGFYGGVNVGYSWGNSQSTSYSGGLSETDVQSITHKGWEASVEGGYCYQYATTYVACLEARYDFPRERSNTITSTGLLLTNLTYQTQADPFLVGPHLGFLTDSNHMMWYAAGGAAFGEVGGNVTATGVGGTSTANPGNSSTTGWFLGAGIERMIDLHWSWKVEYDYVRYSSNGATAAFTGTQYAFLTGSGSAATLGSHAYDNIMTFGINYHLGMH